MQKPGVAVLVNLKETWQSFELYGSNYFTISSENNYALDHERCMRKNSMHIQVVHSHDLEKLQSSVKTWNYYYNLSHIMFASNREIEWFERESLKTALISWLKKLNIKVEEVGAFLDFYGNAEQLKHLIEEFAQQYEDFDLSLVNNVEDVQAYPVHTTTNNTEVEPVEVPLVPVEALRNVNGLIVEDLPVSDLDEEVSYDEDDEDQLAESMVMSMLEDDSKN